MLMFTGQRAGLWAVIPFQLIVMVGLGMCRALHTVLVASHIALKHCLHTYRHHILCNSRQKSTGSISFVRRLRSCWSVHLDHYLCHF